MTDSIAKMFSSPDDEVRREAVLKLSGQTVPVAIEMLVDALRDNSWRVRKTAVNVLVESFSPDKYMDSLVELLYEGDNAGARNSSMEVFVRLGKRSRTKLEEAFDTKDVDVRKFIVDIAGEIAHRSMIPLLVRALMDEDDNVKAASIEHLGAAKEEGVVQALIDMLSDGQLWTSYPAIEALGRIGDPVALPAIRKALDNDLLREPALRALGGFPGSEVIGYIAPYILSPSRGVRQEALTALEVFYEQGLDAETITSEIKKIHTGQDLCERMFELHTSTKGRARTALLILLALLKDSRSIRPLVEASVESDNLALIIRALSTLGHMFPEEFMLCMSEYRMDAVAVRTLASAMADSAQQAFYDVLCSLMLHDDGHVRAIAARGLGNIGYPGAVELLLDALEDRYTDVGESAMQALINLRDHLSPEVLESLARNQNPAIRQLAVPLLSVLEKDETDCLKGILLDDPSPDVRKVSVQYLSQRLSASCQSFLVGSVDDDHPDVRSTVAMALGKTRDPKFIRPLTILLKDPEPIVRVSACKALGMIATPEILEHLGAKLHDDNGFVVASAIESIARVGTDKARDLISSMLATPDREILCTAIRSLAEFDGIKKLILPYLESNDWAVRYEVAKALMNRVHSPEVQDMVQRAYELDSDDAVRDALKELLDV